MDKRFKNHIGERYGSLVVIDRPENCTWILPEEQMKNTRRTHKITYNGKTMCLTDWAKELNMNRGTLTKRLIRGMSVEEAFTTPLRK